MVSLRDEFVMSTSVAYDLASSAQVIADLGSRLEQVRLSRNQTQAQLAQQAGVSARTVMRLEKGEASSLDTFVRVMQALGLSSYLEAIVPDTDIRPMERIRNKGRERRRARPVQTTPKPFTWNDTSK